MNLDLDSTLSSVGATQPPETKNSKRLADAAEQFESLMIAEMMKTARDTSGGGWLNNGDETGEDSSMSMAEQQFAQTLAKSGGLGLAKMVVQTMAKSAEGNRAKPPGSIVPTS